MNAWQPYTPTKSDPWDAEKIGHLFRRAAFGASHINLLEGLRDGPEKTVDRFLSGDAADADFEKTCEFMASERSLPASAPTRSLAAYWLYRLLKSPDPLREKLALFWHNHFATSHTKVENARYMVEQYDTIHKHALGSFAELLQAMTIDPAMMIWLDTIESKKGKPNENYARELMELFSLGIGHYTEADIREAAKAFTGYTVKAGEMRFTAKEHDDTVKKVFGQSGQYEAKDVVKLCLAQSACPKFLVTKLYRFFISETEAPKPEVIEPLAEQYRESGFDTAKLVGTILRSQLFFSKVAYRQRVKSPVEFAVGIVRCLEGNVGPLPLAESLEGLGQILFAPPSVKGWDGGTAWLNAQTLLFRQNLALALTSTDDSRFGRRCDPVTAWKKSQSKDMVEYFTTLFLQNDLPAKSREKLQGYLQESQAMKRPPFWSDEDVQHHRVRTLAHLTLSLPEYQLC
ncbi:hypothetical protein BH11PLA2_BH11PLA2_41280 [soil metagenome]